MYVNLLPKNIPLEIKPKFINKKLKISSTFMTNSKYSSYLSPKCSILVKNEKKKLSLYDTNKGTLINTIEPQIEVLGVSFSSDESVIYLFNEKIIQKWDLKNLKFEKEIKITENVPKGDQYKINSIKGLNNSQYILLFEGFNKTYQLLELTKDDKVKIMNIEQKEIKNVIKINTSYAHITFLCEENVLLYSIKEEKITDKFLHKFKPMKHEKSIVFSNNLYFDQEMIYSICQDDYFYMWDVKKKKDLYFQAPTQEDTCFFAGDGYLIYPTCEIYEDEKEKFDSPFAVFSMKELKMIGVITYKGTVVGIEVFDKKIYLVCEDRVFIWNIE